MEKMQMQDTISALADGQLQGEAFAHGVQAVAGDAQARAAWHTYHLIGDVLRGGAATPCTEPSAFMTRLAGQLAAEPGFAIKTIAAHARPDRAYGTFDPKNAVFDVQQLPANDASFRWKLVAGFASVAAVGAVAWTLSGGLGGLGNTQPQLAAAPAATTLASSNAGVMIRDERLDELLAAHRQLGGAAALQPSAGMLRNATFEAPAR